MDILMQTPDLKVEWSRKVENPCGEEVDTYLAQFLTENGDLVLIEIEYPIDCTWNLRQIVKTIYDLFRVFYGLVMEV